MAARSAAQRSGAAASVPESLSSSAYSPPLLEGEEEAQHLAFQQSTPQHSIAPTHKPANRAPISSPHPLQLSCLELPQPSQPPHLPQTLHPQGLSWESACSGSLEEQEQEQALGGKSHQSSQLQGTLPVRSRHSHSCRNFHDAQHFGPEEAVDLAPQVTRNLQSATVAVFGRYLKNESGLREARNPVRMPGVRHGTEGGGIRSACGQAAQSLMKLVLPRANSFDAYGESVVKSGERRSWQPLQLLLFVGSLSLCVMSVQGQGTGTGRVFRPLLQWERQVLYSCSAYIDGNSTECVPGAFSLQPDRVVEAGNQRACIGDPDTFFACTGSSAGCKCDGVCVESQCYDVRAMIEDNWGLVGTTFGHNPGDSIPIPFAGYVQDYIQYTVSVNRGMLDIFDTGKLCEKKCAPLPDTLRKECQFCDPIFCGAVDTNTYCTISYADPDFQKLQMIPATGLSLLRYDQSRRTVTFTGTWEECHYILQNMKYRADADINSMLLRKLHPTDPVELMSFSVGYHNPADSSVTDGAERKYFGIDGQANPGNWRAVGSFQQMIHIVDINDAPRITGPSETTGICKPGDPVGRLFCEFGQFFSYEDDVTNREIPGLLITDVDLDEQCIEDGECAKLDVTVRAFKGSVGLNTRSDLEFHDIGDSTGRSGQGFTGLVTSCNNAIKVLNYAVELAKFAGDSSSVLNYNTQHSGQREYLTLTVSDQGFNGGTEISKVSEKEVEITIVAVNDPPIIALTAQEFEADEDVLQTLLGISISDVDVGEEIESSLALSDWAGGASNATFLNKMMVTASLVYGVLKLEYTRNLDLIFTATTQYMTIASLRFGHDVCRIDKARNDNSKLFAAGITVTYQKICIYNNLGSANCPTGEESACICELDGTCEEAKITLHLNRSSTGVTGFTEALTDIIDAEDRTCGGMPIYPAPNNFSHGKKCATTTDCQTINPCIPGETCRCCANISVVCSDSTICGELDGGSLCGCVAGGEGTCGPFWTTAAKQGAPTELDLIQPAGSTIGRLYGQPCHYAGEDSDRCKAGAYAALGTNLARIVSLVSLSSLGSQEIQFFGSLVDINRALASLRYLSNLHYNRFFRIPEEERDPLTFNIEADSVDVLTLVADDMGNSGGSERDRRTDQIQVNVRVRAVNDPPAVNGPATVKAYEDLPIMFSAGGGSHPLQVDALFVSDPDSEDYLYDEQLLTVNLSCSHGRLFLNEDDIRSGTGVIKSELVSSDSTQSRIFCRSAIPGVDTEPEGQCHNFGLDFIYWEGQPKRGLYAVDDNGNPSPLYGEGCRTKAQCSDGHNPYRSDEPLKTTDNHFGFFSSNRFGQVFSPQFEGGPSLGCGFCPENVGNKFISIRGTISQINQALANVTYLPDPHFNTRTPDNDETILFAVNDNGARGNDATAPSLTASRSIPVIIESVNDRPIIGRRKPAERAIKAYDGGVTPDDVVTDQERLPFRGGEEECFNLHPTSDDYDFQCNATVREYIDVDEDTLFYISPEILWIDDVDSEEAELMPTLRRYCCLEAGEVGCTCGRSCRCGSSVCKCDIPEVCSGGGGQLLISLQVQKGKLSLFPPPGRERFTSSEMTFLKNVTSIDMIEGGFMEPCTEDSCFRNTSRLQIRTNISTLQKALEQLYLTYQGAENVNGEDELQIWVSDQGYTDECYNSSLVASATLPIRVVAVNDAPQIVAPDSVLSYTKGLRCYVDYVEWANSPGGLLPSCSLFPNSSRVPPQPPVRDAISIIDVDIFESEFPNMTLTLRVGNDPQQHQDAGSFFFSDTLVLSKLWLEEYDDDDGLRVLTVQGKIEDINKILVNLNYDADPDFQGYAPFILTANDLLNYGECSGKHKCGAGEDACLDVTEAEHHEAALPGITRLTLDVTILGEQNLCGLESECVKCNEVPGGGCGWCPGACQGSAVEGKCMIGGSSGPTFETCPTSPAGLGWRQCKPTTLPVATVAIIASVGTVVFLIVFYVFLKWAQRRHGTIINYVKRKHRDATLVAAKLNILPPSDANYNSFFALGVMALLVIIVLSLMGSSDPSCIMRESFFLDRASDGLTMALDNCKVRFLPAIERASPENQLQALKVLMAFPKDPLIVLESQTCDLQATFELRNDRPESVKYDGYYCNIEVLVPDRFIMPRTTIVAIGTNMTSVRSSPNDKDSPNFGLQFGPNTFSLEGVRMNAEIQRINAKNFIFNVNYGILKCIDLTVTVSADFTSLEADMIVTSRFNTHVDFLQESGDKVCLTAAKNSLYVDNACREVCELKTAGNSSNSSSTRRRLFTTMEDQEDLDEFRYRDYTAAAAAIPPGANSLRQLGASTITQHGFEIVDPVNASNLTKWVCSGDPDKDQEWACEPYDPVAVALDTACPSGADYEFRFQVPQVDGCTDLKRCFTEETPQCLCKPTCDAIGAGVCNIGGFCCSTSCAGYSKADMFPKPDLPRCGSLIDPIGMPWCDGDGMDQNFRFTSKTGQISFQVLVDCEDESPGNCTNERVHHYSGIGPKANLDPDIAVDILAEHKKILDENFHPGGASAPATDLYILGLTGPGTPEISYGKFLWTSTVRHLVLQPWLMSVLSFGLLAPDSGASSSRLDPGFCPAYVDTDTTQFNDRLKLMYGTLKETVERFVPSDPKVLPVGSMIAFLPISGPAKVIFTDTNTNLPLVSLVKTSDYPLFILLLALGVGIPILAAVGGSAVMFFKGRTHLMEYRKGKLMQELLLRNLGAVLAGKGPDEEDDDAVPIENVREMRGRTSFFYMYQEFVGNAEAQRTVFAEWFLTASMLTVAIAPTIFVYLSAGILDDGYRVARCEVRPDRCQCMKETVGILFVPFVLRLLIFIYFFIALLELGLYLLSVSFNPFRRVLRVVFYASFFTMIALTIVCTGTMFLFVILGVLLKPWLAGPYALAVIGALTVAAAMFVKLLKYQIRVNRAVNKAVQAYRSKVAKQIPSKALLDALMGKKIQQALHDNGLSFPMIVIPTFFFLVIMIGVYFFLFMGFEAFTKSSDRDAALINMGIITGVLAAAYQVVVGDGDPGELNHRVEVMLDKIMVSMEATLDMVARQIDIANKLYMPVRKNIESSYSGESSSEEEEEED